MIRRLLNRLSAGRLFAAPPAVVVEEPLADEAVEEAPAPEPEPAPEPIDIDAMARLVNAEGHPNINGLWRLTKDLEAVRLGLKAMAYDLASTLEVGLLKIPVGPPSVVELTSKPCTQGDIETRWCRSWCATLRERPRYHRRIWESNYVMQALYEAQALLPNAKVLALGPVDGTVISYLSRNDVRSTLLGPEKPGPRTDLTDAFTFDTNVTFVHEDEGSLADMKGFDACWSIGQAGRQGSADKGVDFIVRSVEALRPGGTMVHVFDFNFAHDDMNLDNWGSVLLQRRHIEAAAEALEAQGHAVRKLDFHLGHQPLDRYVDMPPYDLSPTKAFESLWQDGWQGAHLKVSIDGFPVTSYGLICRRGDAAAKRKRKT
jgi:hypothetical protein